MAGARAILVLATLSACESAKHAEPTREVEDRLGAVRCKLEAGKVACTGDNTWGLIRDPAVNEQVESYSPIRLTESVIAFDLSPMSRFACAAGASGAVYCWGDAAGGKLGNGETPEWPTVDGATARPVPQRVIGVSDARDVGLGIAHACALGRNGAVRCWGDGADGELGRGDDRSTSGEALEVVASGALEIAVTDAQTCTVRADGRVMCWGGAIPGTNGTLQRVYSPTEVHGIDDATDVAREGSQMCVSRRSGERTCWTPMDWPRGAR